MTWEKRGDGFVSETSVGNFLVIGKRLWKDGTYVGTYAQPKRKARAIFNELGGNDYVDRRRRNEGS